MTRLVGLVVVMCALVAGCAASSTSENIQTVELADRVGGTIDGDHRLFGATQELSATIGNEITTSGVVPMTCIPSRTDPVGVLLGLEIVDWMVADAQVTVSLTTTYAKLGSHPSGCSDPSILIADSMFLLGPNDETLHATGEVQRDDATTLIFELGDRVVGDWTAVLLPTIEYALGNGDRQTSIYGFVGHYALT